MKKCNNIDIRVIMTVHNLDENLPKYVDSLKNQSAEKYNRIKVIHKKSKGVYENELWSPVVFCKASTVVAVDIDYYHYSQRNVPVIQSSNLKKQFKHYSSESV